MINKYCSAFDGITNSGYLYGKLDCEFFDCFVHVNLLLVRFAHVICTFGARYAFSASAILFCYAEERYICNAKYISCCKCGGKYALYKSSRRAVRGISLAVRQISQAVLISQIREDLYRFSLSAFADKLNFPRALSRGTYPPVLPRLPRIRGGGGP